MHQLDLFDPPRRLECDELSASIAVLRKYVSGLVADQHMLGRDAASLQATFNKLQRELYAGRKR
jgi:hypothetical protein